MNSQTDFEQAPSLMPTQTVADILGVHVETARRLCRNGQLPAVQIGRRWLVPKSKLEERIAAQLTAREA